MVDSLETRRQKLEEKLQAKRAADDAKAARNEGEQQGFAYGLKLSSEFIAAIFVGAVLGYLLDKYVGTQPWGMIFFLLIGFAAGILNVLRATGAVESPLNGPSGTKDNGPESLGK